MSVKTKEFIYKVNSHLNGNVIVLGGWSKHYNGYIENYDKHWIDISITPESVDLVCELGLKLDINGGHSWGNNLKILTPQANIKWHQEAYDMLQYEWLSEKIANLKNLYNI